MAESSRKKGCVAVDTHTAVRCSLRTSKRHCQRQRYWATNFTCRVSEYIGGSRHDQMAGNDCCIQFARIILSMPTILTRIKTLRIEPAGRCAPVAGTMTAVYLVKARSDQVLYSLFAGRLHGLCRGNYLENRTLQPDILVYNRTEAVLKEDAQLK